MEKQTEYEALREEILNSLQIVKNYRSLLYTIVFAALAFAFDKDEAIIFLIPFCAIIPIYLLAMHQVDSTMRIGAYIYVFLEPETECQWETRLLRYDNLHRNQESTKKTSIDPYWGVSFCCLLLSIVKLDYTNIDLSFIITVLAQIIILCLCCILFLKKRPDYLKVKEKYINEWKEVQRLENAGK